MDPLHPCPSCHRHVRASEPSCPFCAADTPAPPRRRLPVGRLTRAAVFTWALAGAAGCGDDEVPPDARATGIDAAVVTADAAPADAAPADAAPADADTTDADPTPDAMVPLPYGAPPARSRLV